MQLEGGPTRREVGEKVWGGVVRAVVRVCLVPFVVLVRRPCLRARVHAVCVGRAPQLRVPGENFPKCLVNV